MFFINYQYLIEPITFKKIQIGNGEHEKSQVKSTAESLFPSAAELFSAASTTDIPKYLKKLDPTTKEIPHIKAQIQTTDPAKQISATKKVVQRELELRIPPLDESIPLKQNLIRGAKEGNKGALPAKPNLIGKQSRKADGKDAETAKVCVSASSKVALCCCLAFYLTCTFFNFLCIHCTCRIE